FIAYRASAAVCWSVSSGCSPGSPPCSASVMARRTSTTATTTPTRRSVPTSAARPRCTSSRLTVSSARATSRSSMHSSTASRSSAPQLAHCRSCPSRWTARAISSPTVTSSSPSDLHSGSVVREYTKPIGGGGQSARHPLHHGPGHAAADQQGLPHALVLPAGRDRPVQLHHPADLGCLPHPVLRSLDVQGDLPGRLRAPERHRDLPRLRDRAQYLVRGPRRSLRAADPPLGGAAVRRLDGRAHDADLLHRRVPTPA